MTDQHPLHPKLIDALSEYRTCDEAMRAAADWQLEQVIQLWYQCLQCMLGEPGLIEGIRRFDQKLRAMLPTTPTEDNQ